MSTLVSHPTGNANVRAVLRAFKDTGTLSEFWTTVAVPTALTRLPAVPSHFRRRLSQRTFNEVSWAQTRRQPWREMARLASRTVGVGCLTRHETGWACVDRVYQSLDRAVARRVRSSKSPPLAVYAYEDGALETFRAAQDRGVTRVYDLPIAHWRGLRALLQEEAERLPDWACTMEGILDSDEKCARKDAEIELADHILVASTFTRDSLVETFGDRPVHITPYGCPPPVVAQPARRRPGEPLRLFYAGHLSQRKGLAYLITAVEHLEIDWRLTLAGPKPTQSPQALEHFLADHRVTWLGTVPHATLLEHMANAHVFVFPSIVEGFGMVITEAMACGLPVITTPHTAGPDILEQGVDGIIVPIRDPAAIISQITRLADNEELRFDMGRAALAKAARSGWEGYQRSVASIVRDAVRNR